MFPLSLPDLGVIAVQRKQIYFWSPGWSSRGNKCDPDEEKWNGEEVCALEECAGA